MKFRGMSDTNVGERDAACMMLTGLRLHFLLIIINVLSFTENYKKKKFYLSFISAGTKT